MHMVAWLLNFSEYILENDNTMNHQMPISLALWQARLSCHWDCHNATMPHSSGIVASKVKLSLRARKGDECVTRVIKHTCAHTHTFLPSNIRELTSLVLVESARMPILSWMLCWTFAAQLSLLNDMLPAPAPETAANVSMNSISCWVLWCSGERRRDMGHKH